MSNTRSFRVESMYRGGEKLRSEVGGRYNSISPSNAAKKAFSMAIRRINPEGRVSLEIHMRETTQGSDKKIYKYKVTKKNNKKTIQVGDREIVYKYETSVKSLNV